MRFKALRFKNFLSFGNNITEIDLNSNKTILITGENGSGKTTVMEALYFVISGKPYRDINKPELINTTNKKELLVELDFDHNNHEYLVKRGIKPDIFELYKDGKLIDKDSETKDYQKMLEAIIGIDANTFGNTVFVSSKNYKPFMKLSAAEKRSFIENMLNIKIFSEILEQTKIKRTLHTEKHNTLVFNLKNNNDKLNIAKESNEKYAKNNEQEIIQINERISEETAKFDPINSELEKIENYLVKNDFTNKIENINIQIESKKEEEIIKLKDLDSDYLNRIDMLNGDIKNNNNMINDLKDEINQFNIALSSLNNDEKNVNTIYQKESTQINDDRIRFCDDEHKKFDLNSKNIYRDIEKNDKQIEFYKHTSECPTCKQSIDQNSNIISNHIKELEEENSILNSRIKNMENELKNACLKHTNEESIKRVFLVENKTKKLSIINEQKAELNEKIVKSSGSIKLLTEKNVKMDEQLSSLNEQKSKEITAIKTNIKTDIDNLNSQKIEPESLMKKATDKKYSLINTEKVKIQANIDTLKERLNELSSIEKKELIDTTVFEKELVEIDKSIKESEYHKETIEQMIKMLGDKGLKSYIVKKYIPTVNELTNKYLEIFSAPYRISFDENFDLSIHSKGYEKLSYGSFSSGEEQRTDLSLLFAFFELGKIKSSINTNIVLMDEISDKSLDSDGLNGLFLIFENMKRNGQTIFNISHRPEVRDRFDITYKVNKNRFSTIEEI